MKTKFIFSLLVIGLLSMTFTTQISSANNKSNIEQFVEQSNEMQSESISDSFDGVLYAQVDDDTTLGEVIEEGKDVVENLPPPGSKIDAWIAWIIVAVGFLASLIAYFRGKVVGARKE